jgi:hypothetical protein
MPLFNIILNLNIADITVRKEAGTVRIRETRTVLTIKESSSSGG